MAKASLFYLLIFIALLSSQLKNSLPPPEQTRRLCALYKFGRMKIYAPDHNVVRALNGSNVQLTVGIPNNEVHAIAANIKDAEAWFQNNIQSYVGHVWFRYIVVGYGAINENSTTEILQSMNNVYTIVSSHKLQDQIKITTEVGSQVLDSYTIGPSLGTFKNSSVSGVYMEQIVKFLNSTSSPLFIINYPHAFYPASNQANSEPYWQYGFNYGDPMSVFISMVDVFYSAMEKVGGGKVRVEVGETGWPSAGGDEIANVGNAKKYICDLAERVLSDDGTPMRPGQQIETYVYAMFNENLREGMWKIFGLFNPDLKPVYGIPELM